MSPQTFTLAPTNLKQLQLIALLLSVKSRDFKVNLTFICQMKKKERRTSDIDFLPFCVRSLNSQRRIAAIKL